MLKILVSDLKNKSIAYVLVVFIFINVFFIIVTNIERLKKLQNRCELLREVGKTYIIYISTNIFLIKRDKEKCIICFFKVYHYVIIM